MSLSSNVLATFMMPLSRSDLMNTVRVKKSSGQINLHKGPFIFYEVGGLVGFQGEACQKIWLQRGGQPKTYGV